MSHVKRCFDISTALALCLVLAPIIFIVSIIVLMKDGRPLFYVSERMKTQSAGFKLYKFRTMKNSDQNTGVSGGDKSSRITKCGHFLRRTRLDELPQLVNVLKGDISFVGPRPPLRQYVEEFPEIYRNVLKSRPGIKGLASLKYHSHEERILARTSSAQETDAVYKNVCIPRKAKLDLIYQRNRNICFDICIMIKTVLK